MLRTVLSLVALASLIAVHVPPASAQEKPTGRASAPKPSATAVVNINTASVAEFEVLPGIGAKTAARIVEYRQKNGPFKKIEELMNVRGIGEKNFLKLKAQLTVAQSKVDNDHER
jgi:competence protein ComEA